MQTHTVSRVFRLTVLVPDGTHPEDAKQVVESMIHYAAQNMRADFTTQGAPGGRLTEAVPVSPHDPMALEAVGRRVLVAAAVDIVKDEAKRLGKAVASLFLPPPIQQSNRRPPD
jgi:hypothetical protein